MTNDDHEMFGGNPVERNLAYLAGLARRHDMPQVVSLEMRTEPKGGIQAKVTSIFQDRVQAEKAILRQLFNEVTVRELIHKVAVKEIDETILRCENWLNEIRALREKSYVPDPEGSLWFGVRRTALEQKILDLQGERRAAESEAWRDLSTLRRYVLFSLRDYWGAARRSELLRWEPGTSNEALPE